MRHHPRRQDTLTETIFIRKTVRPLMEVAVDDGLRTSACRIKVFARNDSPNEVSFYFRSKPNPSNIVETMALLGDDKHTTNVLNYAGNSYAPTDLDAGDTEERTITLVPGGEIRTYVDLPAMAANGTIDSYLEVVSEEDSLSGRVWLELTATPTLVPLSRDDARYNLSVAMEGTGYSAGNMELVDGEPVVVNELDSSASTILLVRIDDDIFLTGMTVEGSANVTYEDSLDEFDSVLTRKVTVTGATSDIILNITTSDTPDPVNSVAPSISGDDLDVGTTWTCTPGTWLYDDPEVPYTYQWLADGVEIVGQTAATHVLDEDYIGQAITCEVTATNDNGTTAEESSNSAVVTPPPANTVAPLLSGADAEVGTTWTCTTGTWLYAVSYARQWFADDVAIVGETNSTYVLEEDYIGQTITCVVTATNVTDSTAEESSNDVLVIIPLPINTVAPLLSGADDEVGTTWTCTEGTWTWNPDEIFAYQWLADGVEIVGETANTYVLEDDYIGQDITCEVTVTNDTGDTTEESSNSVTVALPLPVNTVAPSISGADSEVGTTWTCTEGTWLYAVTYAYQWFADDGEIVGETADTYVLEDDYIGQDITCEVTATNATGDTAEDSSNSVTVALPLPVNTVAPSINGADSEVGTTWTCTTGTWLYHDSLTFQWFADDVEIVGETANTHVLDVTYLGQTITCEVTATNATGTTAEESSNDVVVTAP